MGQMILMSAGSDLLYAAAPATASKKGASDKVMRPAKPFKKMTGAEYMAFLDKSLG